MRSIATFSCQIPFNLAPISIIVTKRAQRVDYTPVHNLHPCFGATLKSFSVSENGPFENDQFADQNIKRILKAKKADLLLPRSIFSVNHHRSR